MTSLFYYLLFGFTWLVSLTPYWLLYFISNGLFLVIYYLARYRKKTVLSNLRSSFPEKSEAEIQGIARGFYRHFSDFLVESSKMISISQKKLNKRIKFINPEVFTKLADNRQNFALVTAHYGNWEWMTNLPERMDHRCIIIYRPLKNKVMDRLSLFTRGRYGTRHDTDGKCLS